MPASVSRLRAGKAGSGFNFQTARSITSRPTIKFLTTFTATVRTAHRIAVRAALARAAVSVVVAEERAVCADQFRAALGSVSLAARVAGLLPIPSMRGACGLALRLP